MEDLTDHASFDVTVEGTSFTYPETASALKPGNTYSWSVQPEIDIMGGTSDSALIVIAGGAERDAIAAALAAITQTGDAGDRARAQVYFDKRVWYDAAQAYSILIAAHPDDAELHRMRGTLYDQVPATQKLADQDFAMVKERARCSPRSIRYEWLKSQKRLPGLTAQCCWATLAQTLSK